MYRVSYSHVFQYRPLPSLSQDGQTIITRDEPALELILRRGQLEHSVLAVIDTGATFSLFSCEIGEVLGLPIREGRREHLRTLGGSITGYAHTVEIEIAYGWLLGSVEVLFSEVNIPRNLLGRSDFLLRVQVGLWERAGIIYLQQASA